MANGPSLSCPFFVNNVCPGDGTPTRTVTTTRPTEVPCLQADGTWGTAGVDEACIAPGGVPGVESYGAVTNYWTNSTTPESWNAVGGVPTYSGNTVIDDDAGVWEGTGSATLAPADGTWVLTCFLRAGTLTATRMRVDSVGGTGSNFCDLPSLTSTSTRYQCSATLAGGTGVQGKLYVGGSAAATGNIIADQCQLEKQVSTPGRRCDSGGTATTCGAELNTVGSTGFPTTRGELEIEYTPAAATASTNRFLFNTRVSGTGGLGVYVLSSNGAVTLDISWASGSAFPASLALPWNAGQPYRIKIIWNGTTFRAYRDGTLIIDTATAAPMGPHSASAHIGCRADGLQANGTVRILYIGEPR